MFRLFLLCFLVFFTACQEQSQPKIAVEKKVTYKKIKGITMGVVAYQMTYKEEENLVAHATVDSLLAAFNKGNSHYDPNSTLSLFNKSEKGITIENSGYDQHFINNVIIAKAIADKTEGYFDPTVASLMKYYGFRKKEIKGIATVDTGKVMEIMKTLGFDKISVEKEGNQYSIQKTNNETQLDFSAIAKGYALDEVGHFFEEKGIQNYWIDIGGESRTRGESPSGRWWRIGIQDPRGPRNTPIAVANMENRSMATSGNYESFRIVDGEKIGHTMNPKTGFPELNNLLSATAFAKDCSVADSYATAFMTMGMEKAFNLAQKLPEIETYLVYFDENGTVQTKYTAGLEGVIDNLH